MQDANDPKVIARYAESAVAKMAELRIPPTPNHFTVWFYYFAGSQPDLRKTLDAFLDGGGVTIEQTAELFERFFTFDQEGAALHDASTRIETAVARAMNYLDTAGSDAAEYGEVLAGATGELSADAGEDQVRQIVDGIVQATREMESQTRQLEKKLEESSAEVSDLRQEIEATRREAATDGLTGIANRKVFDSTLRQEALAASNSEEALCLLMIDIDHFKKFNDNYGHQTGDQVLKLLANTLTEAIKGQDTAARYGGEEFGVILPRTPLKAAAHLGEEIRNRLASKQIVNRRTGETLGSITLSVGVGLYRVGEPVANLISRADAALYGAKGTGRNRVVTEDELSEDQLAMN